MIPVSIARILEATRLVLRTAAALITVLVGIGIASQCAGCATAGKVASVVEPIARVTCAVARKLVTVCDVAFPETAASCPVPSAGGEDAAEAE